MSHIHVPCILFFTKCGFIQKAKENASELKRKRSEIEEVRQSEIDEPRQCFGPGCIEPARSNSKYCSDECGLKLAKRYNINRIFLVRFVINYVSVI